MSLSRMFARTVNMSLTASLVILLVLGARLILRKAPKVYSYALWAVVLFRLLCPVSLPSFFTVRSITAIRKRGKLSRAAETLTARERSLSW